MDGSDSARSLLGKHFTAVKSGWLADAADIFILLCSFLLTTASIVLAALIFNTQGIFGWDLVPRETLSILQRVISALSTTITSALIVVAAKRYVLFKLARGGIRSRRVAVYSRPSIGNLAYYLVWHGFELPLLALSVVWALGLATGLTVNDAWAMVPTVQEMLMAVPFGPFGTPVAPGSLLVPASGQLSYAMASVCSGVAGTTGLIQMMGGVQLASGGPMGALFYPPLPYYTPNSDFSLSTSLNGFNVSMESLSSIPPTAQNLTCVDNTGYGFSTGQLWYEGGDNQTLSIIATLPDSQSLYRFNASAIILGGTLQSTGNATEFLPNGTTWPNVMSNDRWAQDIASLVCNATYPTAGSCAGGASLLDFAIALNTDPYSLSVFGTDSETEAGIYWSTALGMAMGAYSSASWPTIGITLADVPVTLNDVLQFTPRYGVYVLVTNVVVSAIMLVVVVRLRMASRLGGDFIDTTRLLLDPLKKPELFNASLETIVDTLANPYMMVKEDSEFMLVEDASSVTLSEMSSLSSEKTRK
ncbi:hypothetical protein J3R83DRAFT_12822 [Lanmaoa asiatica]|nr:hypothetical protein J3R83DRAFT_12822 [Lanmaoa asiatica]